MSFHTRLLALMEVVLRVPPLFAIDELLKIGIGLNELHEHDLSEFPFTRGGDATLNLSWSQGYNPLYGNVVFSIFRLLIIVLGCAAALCVFILSTKHLFIVYMYFISHGMVILSYMMNLHTIKNIKNMTMDVQNSTLHTVLSSFNIDFLPFGNDHHILKNYIFQSLFSIIFNNVHLGPKYPLLQKLIPLSFLTPSFILMFSMTNSIIPDWFLIHTPIIATILPYILLKYVLWTSIFGISRTIYIGYISSKTYISTFGMSALVEAQWSRLKVPEVLRIFWILRVFEHLIIFYLNDYWYTDDGLSPHFRLLKYILVTGCDTLTSVLGITSIVSYICNYIGKFFQWWLLTDDENDKNFGTVSAIVFYVLALQTGLTGLEPDKRFVRLCRNFCLLFTAILHFIHNVVNPLLMSLSASHNPSVRKHVHALLVCFVLVLFPILLMYYLWTTQDTTTWLLAVTAFCIEIIVKVFVSLAIYALFLLDAQRDTFWEKLDDYIYYIRSFGNTVEFCFGIFLFFNGAWILIFESGSAIRAIMMCIHAYFNIWCDAKAGWSVFIKRRTAVNKIETLPEANEHQLRALDDVCAICYQEMKSAKITKCRHFFHGVCLRKWLYVQDRCPLCHEILHRMDIEDRNQTQRQHQQNNDIFPINDEHIHNR